MATEIHRDQTIPVSVVVLAKNEEVNIERCLRALTRFDEVVVVDDNSTDQTVAISRRLGARVLDHRFVTFAGQRNWAMREGKLRHPWVLHLDADEVVDSTFCTELYSAVLNAESTIGAFCICRRTILEGTWLRRSEGFPVWIMRLVHREKAVFQDQGHGEVAVPDIEGQISQIVAPLTHYAFSKGLANWIARHNAYSDREAKLEQELEQLRDPRSWTTIVRDKAARRTQMRQLSRKLPFRGFLRTLYHYIVKRGFLDGRAGWQYSYLMGTYESWIVMKKRELKAASKKS
ncbi:glycosyltransferase involved in cell wall biosynthesis [Rhodopirellula rubra]|uniref:Glycosyltransferase involved in cell wall biosynthesis n=1 Tax=Aporhodopirellula rubra TaxID=980271 RepID=A0A7W5DXL2_9BACT|nr:glycosyltransferase family 2 protein [Aporhodopirellula rubra]MBB3206300.1 glycosyltransferase involved in cell wall biosynthesis [Aporhodopirellula rubra]